MDKRHYSAFSGTDLDIRLRERRVDTVILTEFLQIFVSLHTAIDAYNLGLSDIVKPAELPFAWESCLCTWHFKNTLGAKLVDENLLEITDNTFQDEKSESLDNLFQSWYTSKAIDAGMRPGTRRTKDPRPLWVEGSSPLRGSELAFASFFIFLIKELKIFLALWYFINISYLNIIMGLQIWRCHMNPTQRVWAYVSENDWEVSYYSWFYLFYYRNRLNAYEVQQNSRK